MTISVHSRIFVTTPDGRSHTGVVTGLRGQGMADLLLDDGRAVRQPVSALRPALARPNGRHARRNPRARRNTGDDVYLQAARLVLGTEPPPKLTDQELEDLTGKVEKAPAVVASVRERLQLTSPPILKRATPRPAQKKAADVARVAHIEAVNKLKGAETLVKQLRDRTSQTTVPALLVGLEKDSARLKNEVTRLKAEAQTAEDAYKQQQGSIDAMNKSTALFFADGSDADDSEEAAAQLAAALRTALGDTLIKRVAADNRVARETWDEDTQAAGDNYILLLLLLNLLSAEDTTARAAGKSKEERQEEGLQRQARAVRVGRQEDRTEGERALRARRKDLGGIDLQAFLDRQKIAAAVVPDPLRATKDKGYLCGNALDGYAYTLATTSEKRMVKHWLTWRDLGYTGRDEGPQLAPSYEVISTGGRKGERLQKPEAIDIKSLIALFDGEKAPLGRAYGYVQVSRKGSAGHMPLTRTPVSRRLEDGGVYNEFEVSPVRDGGQDIVYTTQDDDRLTQSYAVVDIKPALQRVRAGTQGGSLYPRRPMPPESGTPGEFNLDAPVLLTTRAGLLDRGAFGSPDVFGFTVDVEVETASLLLDKYKAYPGYSFKDRSPYFSWQPEAAGQFSALQGVKGERPCTDPDVVAQLNAMRKASSTLSNLVKHARRLNEVLTEDDGLSTTDATATQKKLVPVFQRLVDAGVRVARLSTAIREQRYIKGLRRDTSSDFSVFTDSTRLLSAVQGAPTEGDPQAQAHAAAIPGVLRETCVAMKALDVQLQKVEIVRAVTTKQKDDTERVDFTPAELEAYFARLARHLQDAVSSQELAEGVNRYTLSQKHANVADGALLLTAGALASGACFAEVLASLFSLARLAPAPAAGEPETAMTSALSQSGVTEQLAKIQLRTACTPHAGLTAEERTSLTRWWQGLRASLPDEARTLMPSGLPGLQLRFASLLDLLFAREISALESSFSFGRAYAAQSWEGGTDPTAAVILYLYTATFVGQANIGGLLGRPVARAEDTRSRARSNAGGSTEDDNMSKRAAQRGYVPSEPASREEQLGRRARQEELQRKPRAERRQLESERRQAAEVAATATVAGAATAAAAATAERAGADAVTSLADRLHQSMEFVQRTVVGGGTVAQIAGGVKMHYTYNPLLFQLVRLYYRQDTDRTGAKAEAQSEAQTNPKPKPAGDVYNELASMLAPTARLPDFSAFALQIADPSGPAPTLRSLLAQIQSQTAAFPKVYAKTLSYRAGKQIPPVQVANELRANVPSLSDSLSYYRSRVERAAQEGEGSKNPDADRQMLLLYALHKALSRSPGTPASLGYDPQQFNVAAQVTGAVAPAPAPAFVAPARPYQAPTAPQLGDTSSAPALSPRVWRGFSQAGSAKGAYAFDNKDMLYMIDWIGVYGSLLDLVRRAVLKFEAENQTSAGDWDEVHEGWVSFFADKTKATKGDGKGIPQLWLDLCPAERDLKLWVQLYTAATNDESGHTIRDLVLKTKTHAARGLSFAGELARRGHGDAGRRPDQHHLAAPSAEDLFLRRGGAEVDNARTTALTTLIEENAPAFSRFMKRRAATAKSGDDAGAADTDRQNADAWAKVAARTFTSDARAVTLVRLSLRPLLSARLLSAEDAGAIATAVTEYAASGGLRTARNTASLPAALASTYVAALLRFRDQHGEKPVRREYPTAPNVESVRSIQATAADTEQEPPDSFLAVSLDREHMRGTLLRLIEAEQKRLLRDIRPS
jgi:hypothetical protein